MLEEACEAPAALERMLASDGEVYDEIVARLKRSPPPFAFTVARGSSDHAATYAGFLFASRAGRLVATMPPSLWTRARSNLHLEGALALAVSQSGQGPDIIETARFARERGALAIAIVNDPASPLAEAAEFALDCRAGPERSIAATKSVICTLAVIARLTAAWTEDAKLEDALSRLPEAVARAQALSWEQGVVDLFSDVPAGFIIGRGPGMAVVQEMALKLQELAGLFAIGMSSAEFHHGPKALLGPGGPALLLPSEWTGEELERLIERAAGDPAMKVETIGRSPSFPCPEPLHPDLDPILVLSAFHGAADALARSRGLNPDNPAGLQKVTKTL